jgi:hypothetical protein
METNIPNENAMPSSNGSDAHLLPSFKILQDAVYEVTRVEYNWRLDRKRIFMAPCHYRELTLRSVKELNLQLHTKPAAEAGDFAHGYLRCITVLVDQVYNGGKDISQEDPKMAQRCELIHGLWTDLLALIEDVKLHWADCNAGALKVPTAVFEPEEEALREQVWQLEKCLKGRHLDKELVELILEPFHQMVHHFHRIQLTWQRFNYNKQLMKKLMALYKEKKFTNESLLDLLMKYNFNHPEVINLYMESIETQMAGRRPIQKKILFLRESQKKARSWHIPEFKGLHPDATCVRDTIITSLEDHVAIQEIHEAEEALKDTDGMPLAIETKLACWLIRMLREIVIDSSVSLKSAIANFKKIFLIRINPDSTYNASFEMNEDEYDEFSALIKRFQRFLDDEWKRIKLKKASES